MLKKPLAYFEFRAVAALVNASLNVLSRTTYNHVAAVALYVAHYNLCRIHEALRTTPAKAIGVADRAWTIAQLVDAALAVAPAMPLETPPDRRRKFVVIEGGKG